MNYADAIDPNFGQYTFANDILITPFWKREFCEYLIEQTRQSRNKFETINDVDETIHYLNFTSFDRSLSEQINDHFIKDVRALLGKEWHLPPHQLPRIYTPFVLWYESGKFVRYLKHTDRFLISTNIKLNNNYKGCNIHFPKQKFSTEHVPVGHAVFWPGNLTHPHYVDDLLEGEKFSTCIFTPNAPSITTETVWNR